MNALFDAKPTRCIHINTQNALISTASNIVFINKQMKILSKSSHIDVCEHHKKKTSNVFLSTTLWTCNYCVFLSILCFSVFISVFSFTFIRYWMHWSILCNCSVLKSLLFASIKKKNEYNISLPLHFKWIQCRVCAFSWQSFLCSWNWHVLPFWNDRTRHSLYVFVTWVGLIEANPSCKLNVVEALASL